VPPLWFCRRREGHTRWRERGWESPNSNEGTYTVVIEEGRAASTYKSSLNIWLFSFYAYFPSEKFLPISFKIQLLETEGTKTKAGRCLFFYVFSLPVNLNSLHLLFLFTFCQFFLPVAPVTETAEIETGMAEKSSWDQANIRQKLGLAWRNKPNYQRLLLLTVLPLTYFMTVVL
jgi:hypothetical protein